MQNENLESIASFIGNEMLISLKNEYYVMAFSPLICRDTLFSTSEPVNTDRWFFRLSVAGLELAKLHTES